MRATPVRWQGMTSTCSSSSARRGSHTFWRLFPHLSPPVPPALHSEYCSHSKHLRIRQSDFISREKRKNHRHYNLQPVVSISFKFPSLCSVQAGEEQWGWREPSEWQVLQEDSFLPHHHTQRVLQAGLRLQRGAGPRVQQRAQSQLGQSGFLYRLRHLWSRVEKLKC